MCLGHPGSSPDPEARLVSGMGRKYLEHLGPETAGLQGDVSSSFFLNTTTAPSCSLITASSSPPLHTHCLTGQDKHLSMLWVCIMGLGFVSLQSPSITSSKSGYENDLRRVQETGERSECEQVSGCSTMRHTGKPGDKGWCSTLDCPYLGTGTGLAPMAWRWVMGQNVRFSPRS